MSLTSLIIALVIIGVVLYLINNYLPIDSRIRTIINIIITVAVIIWLLAAFGLLSHIERIRL